MAVNVWRQIKDELRSDWDSVSSDKERWVQETADSYSPVYNSDIIAEWTALPSEDSDRWQEFGYSPEGKTIVELMAIDLNIWYYELATRVLAEFEEELERNGLEEAN